MSEKRREYKVEVNEQVDEIYQYVGEGLGIPGLPHEMTRAQAEQQGVAGLFEACLERGVYVKKSAMAQKKE